MFLDIISFIFDIAIMLLYFHSIFKERRKQIPLAAFVILLLSCEGILFVSTQYFTYAVTGQITFFIPLISIIDIFAQTFLYESSLKHRIFVTISYQVYCIIAETLIYAIFLLLPKQLSDTLLANNTFCLLASKFILFLLVVITNLVFHRKTRRYSMQYTALILLMPLLSIIILFALTTSFDINSSQTVFNIISILGLLVANMVNYFLLGNILQVRALKETQKELNRQLDFQANKYQQISTAYRNTRSLMHDTKKHFFYIQDSIKNERYSDISEYLSTAIERIESSYNRINTGNLVIDAFVSNHLSLAERENIEFRTKIQLQTENIRIDDYDLSVILGNLLDNSLDACRKITAPSKRQIEVELFTTNLEFVIHISNTVAKEVLKSEKNELMHGYGTTNVNTLTLQYKGSYTHYIEDGFYHAIVSIPVINKH